MDEELIRRAEDLARRCERSATVTATSFLTPAQAYELDAWAKRALDCTVLLRGSVWQIDNITAKDVAIRVDLTDAVEGTELYKAEIYVTNPSFPSIGAVGSYTIAVELEDVNAAN